MNRLSMTQRKWLLTAHIAFVVLHMGALFSLLVLNFLASPNKPAYLLIGKLDIVLVPATGIGMLVTGLLLGALTHWGLLKFHWIIVKNAGSLVAFLSGILVHKSAIERLVALAAFDAVAPGFLAARSHYMVTLSVELLILAPLIAVSVFKPWGQRRKVPLDR